MVMFSTVVSAHEYTVMFTISGGILPLHAIEEMGYSAAMKLTDFSLNEAKKLGRNRCYVFEEKEYRQFLRRSELKQELRNAVINDFKRIYRILSAGISVRNRKALWRGSADAFYLREVRNGIAC